MIESAHDRKSPGTFLSTKDIDMKQIRRLAWPFGLGVWLIYVTLLQPQIDPDSHDVLYRLTWWQAIIPALILGYGLAMLVSLAKAAWGGGWVRLRPSPGRIIGAAMMTVLTPVMVVQWVPFIIGPFLLMAAVNPGSGNQIRVLLATIALIAIWYVPAALISAGIADRLWRVAAYALLFWSGLAAVLLWQGVSRFVL